MSQASKLRHASFKVSADEPQSRQTPSGSLGGGAARRAPASAGGPTLALRPVFLSVSDPLRRCIDIDVEIGVDIDVDVR